MHENSSVWPGLICSLPLRLRNPCACVRVTGLWILTCVVRGMFAVYLGFWCHFFFLAPVLIVCI